MLATKQHCGFMAPNTTLASDAFSNVNNISDLFSSGQFLYGQNTRNIKPAYIKNMLHIQVYQIASLLASMLLKQLAYSMPHLTNYNTV